MKDPLLKSKENVVLEAKRLLLHEQIDRATHMAIINSENVSSYNDLSSETSSTNNNRDILNKYFHQWRSGSLKSSAKIAEKKLSHFIDNLKNFQNKQENPKETLLVKPQEQCFSNRFKTQRQIIDLQRSKIEEQTKIIDELKLGIIREDLLKSIETTKIDIREIFKDCSEKLLSRAPLVKSYEDREKIMVFSQKAPKTLQKMRKKAAERENYRQIILQRKKLLEETRRRLLAEAIEKKRVLEEEEKKRNLEIVNERRKQELLRQKARLDQKMEFELKVQKAKNFYCQLLKRQCFTKLIIDYRKCKENNTLAEEYFCHKRKIWALKNWLKYVDMKFSAKYYIADKHFEIKLLKKTIIYWKEFKLECVRNMQVAEDLYDFRLTNNSFVYWHRHVCKMIMIELKNKEIASKHYNRKMIFQYFYQWKSLPAVLQLEKAKEEKKRRWREKVWEILPDYQPPL